jgi:putative ABC transport system ATP-binding protein
MRLPPAGTVRDPVVVAEHVSKDYDGGRVRALTDVSVEVRPGELVALVGPSGSGKSTLVHVLGGLEPPSSGRIVLEGRVPDTPREWARQRARRIGFVFQAFHLLPTLTARENVEVPMFGVVASATDRRRRAEALLASVGLTDRSRHRPVELSGGERQRVAIARAIANAPRLILADEPTGNLDSTSAGGIVDLLASLRADGLTAVVLVTHDRDLASRCDRRIELRDGRVVDG